MKRTNGNDSYFGKRAASTCVAMALLLSAASASAVQWETLTFDNVTTNFQDTIPDGYGGFNWLNFGAVNGTEYTSSGYQSAVISSDYVAFPFATTNENATATLEAGRWRIFILNSGSFTAAWNDNLQLRVVGHLFQRKMFDRTYTLSSTSPTFIRFPRAVVTSVEFTASGGTQNLSYTNGSGEHFAMDNLNVTVP